MKTVYQYLLFALGGMMLSNLAPAAPLIQPKPKPVTQTNNAKARDDTATVVPGKTNEVSGNVITNDKGVSNVALESLPNSDYGYVVLNADGSFTYTVYPDAPAVKALKVGQSVKDIYTYQGSAGGKKVKAKLIVTIIGNPLGVDGEVIFDGDDAANVEIEDNNMSTRATPLNSTQTIKGHLHSSGDRDWYSIASSGDEIIEIEVCPQGSVCYNKKNWVMYVFDSAKLTAAMETFQYPLKSYRNDTGETIDLRATDAMYLAYHSGVYEGFSVEDEDGALIGVVDPCFGDTNKVVVGTGPGARRYYVAMSVPLKGSDGPADGCGQGNLILEQPGQPVTGADGKAVQTTDEIIVAFPNSDDQYAIKVSATGNNPLAVDDPTHLPASASIPVFNDTKHILTVPKVRILNGLYAAKLSYKGSLVNKSQDPAATMVLTLKKITGLTEALSGDPFQATFDQENERVVISKMIDSKTGLGYSAVLKYIKPSPGTPITFEVLSVTLLR